jgi:hypothetical protein
MFLIVYDTKEGIAAPRLLPEIGKCQIPTGFQKCALKAIRECRPDTID